MPPARARPFPGRAAVTSHPGIKEPPAPKRQPSGCFRNQAWALSPGLVVTDPNPVYKFGWRTGAGGQDLLPFVSHPEGSRVLLSAVPSGSLPYPGQSAGTLK